MKYCNHQGCKVLVPQGTLYCKAHTRTRAEINKEYDQNARDKKRKSFYNSKEWKNTKALAQIRDNGIDVYLFVTKGEVVAADVVHHIIELKEDYSKRIDLSNLISVSDATHEGPIKAAYADPVKKEKMQQKLRECNKKYEEMMGMGV